MDHINPEITNRIYAIDINPEYLQKTKEKFASKIMNLEIFHANIEYDELTIKDIDLFFVGLILEYVQPERALRKIIKTLGRSGILLNIIQKNEKSSFVSKTKYKSLEKLEKISNEVDEKAINKLICAENMELIEREEIKLKKNKSFIKLAYKINYTERKTLLYDKP